MGNQGWPTAIATCSRHLDGWSPPVGLRRLQSMYGLGTKYTEYFKTVSVQKLGKGAVDEICLQSREASQATSHGDAATDQTRHSIATERGRVADPVSITEPRLGLWASFLGMAWVPRSKSSGGRGVWGMPVAHKTAVTTDASASFLVGDSAVGRSGEGGIGGREKGAGIRSETSDDSGGRCCATGPRLERH